MSSDESSVTVSWSPVTGATSYDLLLDGKVYNVKGTSHKVTGLTPNTSHTYQIRVNNANGSSSYSPVKTVKTLPDAPTTYPTVKATATTDSVTLTWNAVAGATEYELYFNGQTYKVKGTSYKVTGLQDDTSYSYRIRSCNEGGNSSYSSYMTVRTALKIPAVPTGISAYSSLYTVRTLVAPPAMPTNVRATATTNSVTVSWSGVSGATGYKLSFNGESYSLTGTSKTITGLTPDTDYEYSVCAYNAGGNSAYTARQMITTIAVGPAVPSDVMAKAGFNSVTVSFPPVTDAADYDIQFDGVVSHVSGTDDIMSGQIRKVFSDLQPNTEHTFCVRANNEKGSSRFSERKTAKTDISKKNGLKDRSSDSTYMDGRISYMGNDPVNVLTGAFLWSYTCLEDYGKDKLHFTLMYDSDRDAFGRMLGKNWSYALQYLLCMDEDYAYFSTPYGAVIPFVKVADGTFRVPERIGGMYRMESREDASYAVIGLDGTEYVFDSGLVLNRIVENGLVKYRFEKNQA